MTLTFTAIVLRKSGFWHATQTADLVAALFLVFWIAARAWERRFGEIFGFQWYQARYYSMVGALIAIVLLAATAVVALI